MRLIFSIFGIGVLLAGALWWYFEIHQSAIYARAVIPLWEEFDAFGSKPEFSNTSLKSDRDYQGAWEVLRRRRAVLGDIRARFLLLEPSGALSQTHKDFQFLLDGYSAAAADAEKKAKFLANAQDLRELLKEPGSAGEQSPASASGGGVRHSGSLPKPVQIGGANTISDIAQLFEQWIPKTKSIGGELFKEGLSRLIPGIPIDNLLSSWQDAAPVLDTVLQLVQGFDPNLPASQFSKLLQSSNKQTELDHINRFLEEAESVERATTARDILAYRSFKGEGGITKEGLELRAGRLGVAMEELKRKYEKKL